MVAVNPVRVHRVVQFFNCFIHNILEALQLHDPSDRRVQLQLHLLLPKKKGKNKLHIDQIAKAIDIFYPYFDENCSIDFTGGEPLLEYDSIKKSVAYIQKKELDFEKKIRYSITTNGSLIDNQAHDFLSQNGFLILLSFDGYAQEITRRPESFDLSVALIKTLLKDSNIKLETNSVFTPKTIGHLSKSIDFIARLGVENILLSFSNIHSWDKNSLEKLGDELASLIHSMISFYKTTGHVPLKNLRKDPSKGILYCTGGKTRMALSQDGRLWGCYLFSDYFKRKDGTKEFQKYCFGNLDDYSANHRKIHPEVLTNYDQIKMSHCYSDAKPCVLCDDIRNCTICPMSAAYASGTLGKIPAWTCELHRIIRKARNNFWEEVQNLNL